MGVDNLKIKFDGASFTQAALDVRGRQLKARARWLAWIAMFFAAFGCLLGLRLAFAVVGSDMPPVDLSPQEELSRLFSQLLCFSLFLVGPLMLVAAANELIRDSIEEELHDIEPIGPADAERVLKLCNSVPDVEMYRRTVVVNRRLVKGDLQAMEAIATDILRNPVQAQRQASEAAALEAVHRT